MTTICPTHNQPYANGARWHGEPVCAECMREHIPELRALIGVRSDTPAAPQPKPPIELIDHYRHTPAQIAKELESLDELLTERSEDVYRCTCEDGDTPRGQMDYEVNAYSHHPDCPSGLEYHYHVLLAGLAAHFRKDDSDAHPH